MILSIYVDSDTLIRWNGMIDQWDSTYVNNATVTFTVTDVDGTNVSGAVNIAMSYVAGSNGKYQGILPYTVALTAGSTYFVEFTASRAGVQCFRVVQAQAVYHSS